MMNAEFVGKIKVDEFTTPDSVTVKYDCSVQEVKNLMEEKEIRHIPILKDNDVVGILTDRDLRLIERCFGDIDELSVESVRSTPLFRTFC